MLDYYKMAPPEVREVTDSLAQETVTIDGATLATLIAAGIFLIQENTAPPNLGTVLAGAVAAAIGILEKVDEP